MSFHEIVTPAGAYWMAVRYDGVAANLDANFLATCMTMVPVYGDALSVPPWEVKGGRP